MKEVLLFSGGMDSLIAWEYLKRPETLYVMMDHKYQYHESSRSDKFINHRIRLGFLSEFEKDDAEIPLRNMYLSMAAVNRGFDKIWLVVQKDEMSIPDRSEVFLKEASQLLSFLAERTIVIDTPFRDMDKADMVAWYLEHGHDVDTLKNTWACYYPPKGFPIEHCGKCPACFRRFVAMTLNGIHEDWFYKIKKSDVLYEYKSRAERGYYSPERCKRILMAIKDYE